MTTSQEILDRLEDFGYRQTESRRRLLDVLVDQGDGFTAEDLVGRVKGIGRATVYRTIRLLVKQGLVCKLALHEGAPRYVLSKVGHHHHTVCVRCGAVKEFRRSVIEHILAELEDSQAGRVVGHRIEVYVTCDKCMRGQATKLPDPAVLK